MSRIQALEQLRLSREPVQKRRITSAIWQPFLQFRLLMVMLGSTAIVALALGAFIYTSFSNIIDLASAQTGSAGHYAEMAEIQLVHLFRYGAVLFLLYIVLLAVVCVSYTHRLIGPFQPFNRHVEALSKGDYSSRITLRQGDLPLYRDYAQKLNRLAMQLERKDLDIDNIECLD